MTFRNSFSLIARAIAWCGFCSVLVAAEPAGVKLLSRDTLAGWDYGTPAPAHWTIKDGQLSGAANSTPLLSGWTVGDFELRFTWSVKSDGVWTLGLPDVPGGAGLRIALKEGDGCGAVRDGERAVAAGTKLDALIDGPHRADIRRFGHTLTVIVDGRVASETALDPDRRFGFALSVPSGEASLGDLRLEEPRGNALFNGKDLAGWWAPDNKGEWAAENGDLVCTVHRGLNYLRAEKEYGNFTLSLEYKISRGGNSGLGIRTAKTGWPSGDGMELQILDQPGEVKDSTMAIYGNLPPLERADKPDEWNRVVIKADGRMISAWVNGELVQQANTARLPELKHRHLKGWIGVQDHGGKIRFRQLYVHEAPDGLGLAAWYRATSENGTLAVLDRVMNSERLSRADGLRSGVVSRSVPKGGEHVLAELTGPGALVSCWRSYAAGRIAFYFDGESEPRLECPAEYLSDHVPSVAHQDQPVLTALAYAKSLKVVVTDPLPAMYRLEYVTFPSDTPLESYSVKHSGVPRGTLQAIQYRHEGLGGGKLRGGDVYPQVSSEPKTIEPGTTVELASLKGTGIVHWLRLQADRAVLANDDLWLEVTIDGESTPAIAAPARFIFPALGATADPKENSSLVMTRHDGFANLLAMPYGTGLTVAARNRGTKPIEKVAVSMSFDPANDGNRQDYASRMRLRGIFQPAGASDRDLVRQSGGGRWVSLVYSQPEGDPTGTSALVVDGQAREGWASPNLDPFFCRPGESSNYTRALTGRRGPLSWRYLLLAPVEFDHSLVLEANAGDKLGDRLALFYLKK